MKNHTLNFLPVIVCITLFAMWSSCSRVSNLAVTKRHYRDGYNISMAGKTSTAPASTSKAARPEGTLKSYVPDEVKPVKPIQEMKAPKVEREEFAANMPAKEQKHVNKKQHPLAMGTQAIKNIVHDPLSVRKIFSETKSNTTALNAEEGGGIIWTIIAILLVVWLISLLTGGWGLGGLIYIFLVIALVLLLLRLLRIIII